MVVANHIGFAEAERHAAEAVGVILREFERSTIEHVSDVYDPSEASHAVAGLKDILADSEFRSELEAIMIRWIAQNTVLLPPQRTP